MKEIYLVKYRLTFVNPERPEDYSEILKYFVAAEDRESALTKGRALFEKNCNFSNYYKKTEQVRVYLENIKFPKGDFQNVKARLTVDNCSIEFYVDEDNASLTESEKQMLRDGGLVPE